MCCCHRSTKHLDVAVGFNIYLISFEIKYTLVLKWSVFVDRIKSELRLDDSVNAWLWHKEGRHIYIIEMRAFVYCGHIN